MYVLRTFFQGPFIHGCTPYQIDKLPERVMILNSFES